MIFILNDKFAIIYKNMKHINYYNFPELKGIIFISNETRFVLIN